MTEVASRSGRFLITVNEHPFNLDDPLPKGRDILEVANLLPVDQYLLFLRPADGMVEDINLSEPVDVTAAGVEGFMALYADRIFFLVVDGRRFPWGDKTITGEQLRSLARVSPEKEVFYDPKGGRDDLVDEQETVSLEGKEVELFYTADRPTEPALVPVELNGETVRIPRGDYTTETLKDTLGVPVDWDLDIVDKHGSFRTLQPGEHIRVVAKLKFVSHVRQGGSS